MSNALGDTSTTVPRGTTVRMRPLLLPVAALALVAFTPALPSAPMAAPTPPALPVGVTAVDVPDGGSVTLPTTPDLQRLLAERFDPRDRSTLVAAAAEHLRTTWDTDVVVVDEEPVEEDGGDVEVPVPAPFPGVAATGDFDGDGLQDVLTVAEGEDLALVALRGLDGAPIWRAPLDTTTLGWPAGDLTGDGTDDLFSLEYHWLDSSWSEDCDLDRCHYEANERWTWELSARSGADGGLLWVESGDGGYDHEYEETFADGGYEYSEDLAAQDLAGWPWPGGDVDGDGGLDVVLNTIDLTAAYRGSYRETALLLGHESGSSMLEATTVAQVVRGADGDVVLEQRTATGPGISLLERAGDATADGVEDLLWTGFETTNDSYDCETAWVVQVCSDEREDRTETVVVELVDGATLDTAWTVRHEVDPWWGGGAAALLADLDGVPGDDVLVRAMPEAPEATLLGGPLDPDGDPWDDQSVLHLLSGPDGATAWTVEAPTGWLDTVADLGGGPEADLLFSSLSLSSYGVCGEEECTWDNVAELSAVRLDGADGSLLLDSSRTWDLGDEEVDWFWFSWRQPGDHDGDGLVDLDANLGTDRAGVAAVQSAATGGTLFEHVGRDEDMVMLASPLGDLDGDGTDELPVVRGWFGGDGHVEVLAMPALDVLHSFADWWDLPWRAGDQDGRAGDELLRVDVRPRDGRDHLVVESLDGLTLAPRWERSLASWESGEPCDCTSAEQVLRATATP